MKEDEPRPDGKNSKPVNSLTILGSALAGLLGVQKRENLERDFQSGKFWHFFIAGAIVTLLFILVVWLGVQALLSSV